MIRRRHMLLVLALAFGLATAAGALDVPLKFIQFPERRTEYLPYGNTSCRVQDQAPANVKLPKLASTKPFYGTFKLAGQEVLFVLDRQKKEDANYNRLWVDANANRDLSDDAPVDSTAAGSSVATFDAITLQLKDGAKTHPYGLRVQAYLPARGGLLSLFSSPQVDANSITMIISSNCAYTGQFELEGKTYRVAVGDGNCNGTIADLAKLVYSSGQVAGKHPVSPAGDEFLLSTKPQFDFSDVQLLGNHLSIGGKLFQLKLDLPASRMTLTPASDNLVTLNLPEHTSKIELVSEDGKVVIMGYLPGKTISVPQGRYTVARAELTAPDPQGDIWKVSATATAETPTIEARGASVPVKFGPPFRAVAAVEGGTPAAGILGSVPLEFATLDSAQMLSAVEHVSGKNTRIPLYESIRPAEPTYEITTAGGQKVAQGKFEYG